MSADDLRPGERWEWGIKHSQGIRTDPTEARARESLELMKRRAERNYRIKTMPQLVRRRVSQWEPVEDDS